jgi:tetratricopeptide (TPR) repeat protein
MPTKQWQFPLWPLILFCALTCCFVGCRKESLAEAKTLLDSGDFLAARKLYARIITSAPRDFAAHYGLGMTWCAEAMYKTELGLVTPQDWYPAIYQMSVASNFTSGDQVYHTLAILHYNLGACYKKIGNRDDAILRIQQAVAYDSTLLKAYNLLGALYQDAEELDKADLCYRRALILKPDYALAHFNRGALAWTRKDYAAAKQCFQDAVTCDPRNAYFAEWLAKAHAATGGK